MSPRIVRSFVLALFIAALIAPALTAAPLPPSLDSVRNTRAHTAPVEIETVGPGSTALWPEMASQRVPDSINSRPGAVIYVNTFDPAIAPDGNCSLIEALVNANADAATHPDCLAGSGPDAIELPLGTYTLTAVANALDGDNGLPAVTSTITLNGHGATIARSSAPLTPLFRIFYIAAEGNLTLNDLTVSNGAASANTSGGGIRNQGGVLTLNNCIVRDNTTNSRPGRGAGIYNLGGVVTATGTTVRNNTAISGGGGIWNTDGSVVLNDCTIRENTARSTSAYNAIGGGLFNSAVAYTTTMTLNHTTVVSNTADGPDSGGGGIGNSSTSDMTGILTLNDSTVAGNQAAYGAGLWITISSLPNPDTRAFVYRSTISGNTANGQGSGYSDGGGIEIAAAAMTIADSTISGNAATGSAAGTGGGISIYSDADSPFSTLALINTTVAGNSGSTEGGGIGNMVGAGANATTTFVNTIVADNTAPQGTNCWAGGGTLTSQGYNLENANTCNFGQPTDHPNTDPLLSALADNGGPTETRALLTGSPAIDAGNAAVCAASPVNGQDQRGVSRRRGLSCDIGAYEFESLLRFYLPLVSGTGAAPTVSLTRIGAPTWRQVDFHLFSAPIGTAPDYAGFGATVAALLPPPNHLGGQAGAPHAPPYDSELAQGVAVQGFHEGQRFKVPEFSSGNGVYIVWMMVPDPGTIGSSHDFSSGPIIPRSLFPIHLSGVTYQNGAVFDPALYMDDLQPGDTTVDGPSHFPIFIADNTDFGPSGANPVGTYEYRITLTDQQGNGWSIVARFSVS